MSRQCPPGAGHILLTHVVRVFPVARGPCGGLPGAVGVGMLQPPHWLVRHRSSSQRLVPVTGGHIPVDGRGGLAPESLPRAVPNVRCGLTGLACGVPQHVCMCGTPFVLAGPPLLALWLPLSPVRLRETPFDPS